MLQPLWPGMRPVQVPVALATSQPERRVKPAVERLNMTNYFDAIVTAEDNGSPEVREQRSMLRQAFVLHTPLSRPCAVRNLFMMLPRYIHCVLDD